MVALHRAVGRRERSRLAIGDVLEDYRDFREPVAVVELEQRYVAFRIDRVVVGAVGKLVGVQIDPDEVVRQAGFLERDVRRKRAGAFGVVER